MIRSTNSDIYKMEKDEISFYEIYCGDSPSIFDLIINCKSEKEIQDVLKNLYEGTEQAQDKKLTTTLNDLTSSKLL